MSLNAINFPTGRIDSQKWFKMQLDSFASLHYYNNSSMINSQTGFALLFQ